MSTICEATTCELPGARRCCSRPAKRACPMCRATLCSGHSAARGPMGSEAAKNRRCARCGYRMGGMAWPEIAA